VEKAEKGLREKFQFKNVARLAVRNAPPGYAGKLADGLDGIEVVNADHAAGAGTGGAGEGVAADVLLLFVNNLAEAQALAPSAVAAVAGAKPEGILWIAYPKGGSGVKTDVNRDKLWPVVQEYGWRPVRQIAIDDVWSAMRFRPGTLAP
jgi:hypothetical protein